MDKYSYNREGMGKGAVTLVVDFAQAFEKVQLKVVWAWAMHFDFSQRRLGVLCGCFERCFSKDAWRIL